MAVEDGEVRRGTARVMSHEVKRIDLVYISTWLVQGAQALGR